MERGAAAAAPRHGRVLLPHGAAGSAAAVEGGGPEGPYPPPLSRASLGRSGPYPPTLWAATLPYHTPQKVGARSDRRKRIRCGLASQLRALPCAVLLPSLVWVACFLSASTHCCRCPQVTSPTEDAALRRPVCVSFFLSLREIDFVVVSLSHGRDGRASMNATSQKRIGSSATADRVRLNSRLISRSSSRCPPSLKLGG